MGMAEAGRQLGLREARQAILQAYVLTDGTVGDLEMNRSSGDPGLDLAAAEVLRSAVFTPALIEGIHVPVWVQLPMVLRPPRRGDGRGG